MLCSTFVHHASAEYSGRLEKSCLAIPERAKIRTARELRDPIYQNRLVVLHHLAHSSSFEVGLRPVLQRLGDAGPVSMFELTTTLFLRIHLDGKVQFIPS